tara:strand:- start:231 stop:389 length:159 start_codon:yes stop_codon:yes gene_type:complete
MKLHEVFIDARLLERERDAKTFCIDGLKEHYDLSTTDAIYVKNLLDKDKERG